MSWQLGIAEVEPLARGAALLGTGGGGDPYIGSLLATQALKQHGPVEVVTLAELPDDASLMTVAMMGAPTVMVEKLPSLDEVIAPIRAVEALTGRPLTHVVCAEIGGVNSTIPVAAAASLGLPLVDADGMGRAFPELQMVIPTLYGVAASPLGFGDDKGNSGALQTINNQWTERIARVAAVEMGCSMMIAGFSMDGATAREALVADTLSLAIRAGEAIADAREAHRDPVDAAVQALGGRELFAGKVVDVERVTTTGFARGRARIEGEGALELMFQNEHLVATKDGEVLVTTPDLIMVVDAEIGEPITTEALRYGQRVRVLAAPSDPRWHSADGLALAGPGYFGYDTPSIRFDGTREP